MPIREHPPKGCIVMCDFSAGFTPPEMVKRRPAVILSPKITGRPGLCTIVALSTTPPTKIMPYHCQIDLNPELPAPWTSKGIWVKGDMINAIGLHRIDLVRLGKDKSGKRNYLLTPLPLETMRAITKCVLHGMGLSILTKSLSSDI